MKVILTATLVFLGNIMYGQEKRQISNFSACVSDTIFTQQIVPILNDAIKIIRNSNAPAKEAGNAMDNLNGIATFLSNDIERQKKEALESVKPETSKVKKGK